MSGYKADHEQVVKMSKLHTNAFIARRLGISTRQVSRILKKHDASKADPDTRNATMDRETEALVMHVKRGAFGESYGQLGYDFGLSRQAVHQRLSDN